MVFLQQLYNGLALSAIYLAVALGITLIYGLTRLINFAQGQLLVLSSFITYALVQGNVPIGWAIVLATLITAGVGEFLDRVLFRRTLDSPLVGFVISLGLITVIQEFIVMVWSPNEYRVTPPFSGIWRVHGVVLDQPRVLLLGATLAVLALLFLALGRTKAGRGLRALAEDNAVATLMGVPVSRYITATFLLGSAIAGLGGALLATIYPFNAQSGTGFVLVGFAIAIVGGLGSVAGAAAAALLLTLPQSLAAAYVSPEWAPAFGLLATILIILWRPTGIFRSAGGGAGSHFTLGRATSALHAAEARLQGMQARMGDAQWRDLPLERVGVGAGAIILLLAPTILPSAGSLSTATYMVILATAASGFWFCFRQAGIFSMMPGALMGVGGYSAAVLFNHSQTDFWLQLLVGIAISCFVALIVGLVALRTSASYFVILTLVIAQLIVLAFQNLTSVTNGALGLTGPLPPSPLGPFSFSSASSFYYLTLGVAAAAVVVITAITRSHYGGRLIAIRENEALARSLGIHVFRDKLLAFVLFGGISGAAGVMLFYYLHYIEPSTFDVSLAINVQLIVLLGGVAVRSGPWIGAAIFAFLPRMLSLSPVQSQFAYGLALIVVIASMPAGVGGLLYRGSIEIRMRYTTLREKRAHDTASVAP